MSQLATKHTLAAALAAGVVFAIAACGGPQEKNSASDSGTGGGTVQAHAMTSKCVLAKGALDSLSKAKLIPSVSSSWVTWGIPEYQDEQKFTDSPSPASNVYGPLACIVAAQGLASLPTSAAGALMAIVYVDGAIPTGNNAYNDLHLTRGFNCVIIVTTANTKTGHVVPVLSSGETGQCGPISDASSLPVNEISELGTTPGDIPEVARFVEKVNWRVSIGVRCPTAWCNIGNPPNIEGKVHNVPASTTAYGYKKRAVLGWHDQQRVAVRNAAGVLHADLDASVVPSDSLGDWDANAYAAAKREVAQVYFRQGDNPAGTKYGSVWGFNQVGPGNPNRLELKLTDVAHPEDPTKWEVYVNGSTTPNARLHVTYTPHNVPIPKTARFRWAANDEDIWVACILGCCLVDAGID